MATSSNGEKDFAVEKRQRVVSALSAEIDALVARYKLDYNMEVDTGKDDDGLAYKFSLNFRDP